MKSNNKPTNGSTAVIMIACAIIFILFSVSYLYLFQASLLEMVQHAWSGGTTTYHHLWGAAIIFSAAIIITFVAAKLLPLPFFYFQHSHPKDTCYFPAMLCMGLLTAVSVGPDGSVHTSLFWLIFVVMAIMLLLFMAWKGREWLYFITSADNPSGAAGKSFYWLPLAWMMLCMAVVFMMGNTDRGLHTRLSVEHHCKLLQWDKALQAGLPQYDTDGATTMLRAMALARTGQLPERLFNYNMEPQTTSDCLFYGDISDDALRDSGRGTFLLSSGYRLWQTIGFVPCNRHEPVRTILARELRREQLLIDSITADSIPADSVKHLVKPVAKDYLLCACLIDGDLKTFMKLLPKYYPVEGELPKHYREACLLYCMEHQLPVPKERQGVAAELADYEDFCSLIKQNPDPVRCNAALRDNYFGTYWYYYWTKTNMNK